MWNMLISIDRSGGDGRCDPRPNWRRRPPPFAAGPARHRPFVGARVPVHLDRLRTHRSLHLRGVLVPNQSVEVPYTRSQDASAAVLHDEQHAGVEATGLGVRVVPRLAGPGAAHSATCRNGMPLRKRSNNTPSSSLSDRGCRAGSARETRHASRRNELILPQARHLLLVIHAL